MIHIRIAGKHDVSALEELIPMSVRGLSIGYYSPQQIESAIVHVFGVDSQLLVDQTYFIAEINGQIVGCGGWSKRKTLYGGDQFKEQVDPLLDPSLEPARIRAFFVHPHWGRRGIGRSLLVACEASAWREGFTRLELGSTLPGVPLYSALGFQRIEEIELVFPDDVRLPIVRMGKSIS